MVWAEHCWYSLVPSPPPDSVKHIKGGIFLRTRLVEVTLWMYMYAL